jgi:REP element-mobilizing transposase RayT
MAIGNDDDHMHAVVAVHASTSLSDLVQRMKGSSSYEWNARADRTRLRWQEGYWARSIDQTALPNILSYVRNHRTHHAHADLRSDWEQNPAAAEGSNPSEKC